LPASICSLISPVIFFFLGGMTLVFLLFSWRSAS
jgi:hypothetical protein